MRALGEGHDLGDESLGFAVGHSWLQHTDYETAGMKAASNVGSKQRLNCRVDCRGLAYCQQLQ